MHLASITNVASSRVRLLCKCVGNTRNYSATSADSKRVYDVVIVGGGVVGTALAAAAGKHGGLDPKKILLLEASPSAPKFKKPNQPYSNRVSSLTPASVDFL
eukprot:Colp12_sorted_trinity150504_noHs@9320